MPRAGVAIEGMKLEQQKLDLVGAGMFHKGENTMELEYELR